MKSHFSILSIFLILFTYSCKTNLPVASTQERVQKNTEQLYSIVYKNQQAVIKTKETRIITTNESFTNLISELAIPVSDYETILNIDFRTHTLIAYFMGEKISGGFDVDVQNVLLNNNKIELTLKELQPQKGDLVTNALTAPYIFILVPKGKEIIIK